MMRFPVVGSLVLVCFILGAQSAAAQATASSSVDGTIYDKTQAVVVGAEVALTSKDTGVSRNTKSSDVGYFRFDLLPVGTYSLSATTKGFRRTTVEGIVLQVGRTTTLNVTLEAGELTETVIVTETPLLVDVTRTSVGIEVTPSDVENMPLNGRDLGNLAYFAPGARPVNSYDPTKNRIAVFAINGSSGRNVNVTVNGIDDKDNTVGGPVMQLPLTAVQEFDISTQRFSAVNGRSEGAAINVITKSGSNKFHGGAYFFGTTTSLNANDFFSKQSGNPTPQFERQQFGGDVGGPIFRDKAFFFGAIERQREHTAIPVTADAFADLALLKPFGAQPAQTIPTPYFDWRYNSRMDYRFNSNHSAYLSYTGQSNSSLDDQSGNRNDVTAGNFTTNRLIIANFTLNSTFGPRIVNAFTFGYQYWNNLIDTAQLSPFTAQFPSNTYFGTNTNVPQESIQKKWQFRDDVSITHNTHTFRTGIDFVWEPVLGGFFKFNPVPVLTFNANPSAILLNPATFPGGISTPGIVTGMSGTAGDPTFFLPNGAKMLGIYFQDDWKLRKNFNLNLGLRWDKDIGLYGSDAVLQNRTYLALKAIGNYYARAIPHDDNRGISPRVGFAWDLAGNGKHVIRSGYGLYFGQTFINTPLFMLQQSNPTLFATVFSLSTKGPNDPNCKPPDCLVPGTNILLSQWRFGIDPMPTVPPPLTQFPSPPLSAATGRLMDPDYRNPYSQQANIGYTFQINPASVFQVEYVHSLALHEATRLNINPVDPATGKRVLAGAFTAAGITNPPGPINNEQANGRSRYDGLNFSYRRRMTHRIAVSTAYVLSKGVGWFGNAAGFGARAINPFHTFDPSVDFGPLPTDERHRWTFRGLLDLPWGFMITPVVQVSSGRPYQSSQGFDVFGFGSQNATPHVFVPVNDPTNYTFFVQQFPKTTDQAAAILQCLGQAKCFQLPFEAFRGQASFQMDLRVAKSIKFGEKSALRLIFQGFDITNRANFGSTFGGNVQSATFGKPTGFITPAGTIVPKSFRAEFGVELVF